MKYLLAIVMIAVSCQAAHAWPRVRVFRQRVVVKQQVVAAPLVIAQPVAVQQFAVPVVQSYVQPQLQFVAPVVQQQCVGGNCAAFFVR